MLPAGRYALVIKGQAYDFTVAGPITDAAQCLERVDAATARFIPNAAVQMKSASAAPRESSTSLPNWHLTTFAAFQSVPTPRVKKCERFCACSASGRS